MVRTACLPPKWWVTNGSGVFNQRRIMIHLQVFSVETLPSIVGKKTTQKVSKLVVTVEPHSRPAGLEMRAIQCSRSLKPNDCRHDISHSSNDRETGSWTCAGTTYPAIMMCSNEYSLICYISITYFVTYRYSLEVWEFNYTGQLYRNNSE